MRFKLLLIAVFWQAALLGTNVLAQDEQPIATKAKAETAPAGSLRDQYGYFGFVFYFLPKPKEDPSSVFMVLAKEAFPKLEVEPMVTEVRLEVDRPLVGFYSEKAPLKMFTPPDENLISHISRGLSKNHMDGVKKSDRAFVVRFAFEQGEIFGHIRRANELAAEFAERTGALIWDSNTHELFTLKAFKNSRVNQWSAAEKMPDISSQISVNVYRQEESDFCRAVTLGMRKFGLPDLAIGQFPFSDHTSAANLIKLVAQHLVEAGGFDSPEDQQLSISDLKNDRFRSSLEKSLIKGASGTARLQILRGKWQDGDAVNRLLEIGFDHYPGEQLQVKQANLFSELFGSENTAIKVRFNPSIRKASEKAKAMMPVLHTRFRNGLSSGEAILLKAPFERSDGEFEWMWVEVTEWERRGEIRGVLKNNASNVEGLRAGMTVTFPEADVFDFIMRRADGTIEGNQTGKLISKRPQVK